MAYELKSPAELAGVYPFLHISLFIKCVGYPPFVVSLESVPVKDSLSYVYVEVEILYRRGKRLRDKEVASVKVLWRSISLEGDTSEAEATIKAKYHQIVPSNFYPA